MSVGTIWNAIILFISLIIFAGMRVFCVMLFFAAIGLGACRKKQSPLTREEVIQVIKRFDAGWKNKNLKAVDSVLAPAYIYFTQSGGIFGRKNLVQTAGSPEYTLDTVERTEFYVELYENTAVVSTRWQGKGMYKEVYFNENQRCSLTIIKTNGKVEILSEHCTPIKSNRVLH